MLSSIAIVRLFKKCRRLRVGLLEQTAVPRESRSRDSKWLDGVSPSLEGKSDIHCSTISIAFGPSSVEILTSNRLKSSSRNSPLNGSTKKSESGVLTARSEILFTTSTVSLPLGDYGYLRLRAFEFQLHTTCTSNSQMTDVVSKSLNKFAQEIGRAPISQEPTKRISCTELPFFVQDILKLFKDPCHTDLQAQRPSLP